jgi:RHS repeat-associated protein
MTNNIQEINYFLTDHLGSVRAIIDAAGVVKELNDYYAFGAKHSRSDHPQNDNRFKYNGKELQITGNLPYLDYGARKYDSRTGRWFNIDPLAEKYLRYSPYIYVANNPVKLFDLNGMDIWEFDAYGRIVSWVKDKTMDAFFLVEQDADGIYHRAKWQNAFGDLEDIGIIFEFGTIKGAMEDKVQGVDATTGNVSEYDVLIFDVFGDGNATSLFEFMANPNRTTFVEWTHAKIGPEGSGENRVGTSYLENRTAVGGYLNREGLSIRELNHNHPSGRIGNMTLDRIGARDTYHKANPNMLLHIYIHPGQYLRYNQHGLINP